jgi:hypothetical protein
MFKVNHALSVRWRQLAPVQPMPLFFSLYVGRPLSASACLHRSVRVQCVIPVSNSMMVHPRDQTSEALVAPCS